MSLGKLDIYMWKNRNEPLSHAANKMQFKMGSRHERKTQRYKTIRRKHEEGSFFPWFGNSYTSTAKLPKLPDYKIGTRDFILKISFIY